MNMKLPNTDIEIILSSVEPEEATRLQEVWDVMGGPEPTSGDPSISESEEVARLQAALNASGVPERRSQKGRRPLARDRQTRGRRMGLIAGGVVVVLLMAFGVGWGWWQQPITHTAALGNMAVVQLPDGSEVELNSGSSLQYRRHFGAIRQVELTGEAFFDVAHDARPFVVQTFNANVTVLGTRFNVRSWPSASVPETMVSLASGKVSLAAREGRQTAVELAPGDTRRVTQGVIDAVPAGVASVDDATAWRRGGFVFKDEPLGDILGEMSRRFAIEISCELGINSQRRFTYAFDRVEDVETMLHDISLALGLQYRATATGYVLMDDAEHSGAGSI